MLSPADINVPQSSSTLTVRAFNVLTSASKAPLALFSEPVLPGRVLLDHVPAYAFLIEHNESQRRVMFDLGPRKDKDGFAPQLHAAVLSIPGYELHVERDIVEQLQDGGVDLDSIQAVIWSHTHLDHTGDMSKWPSSTKLVIGPGSDRRGYPTVPDAVLLDSDFAGRQVEELSFTDSSLKVAGHSAIDFFKDGSLYIIDMPGHCPGHIVALARVKPDSFILFGGDTCHHQGQIRPNEHIHRSYPCPDDILLSARKSVSTEYFPSPLHPGTNEFDLSKRTTPLLTIPPPPSAYHDREQAIESQRTLSVLDAHTDVFLVTAHDLTLEGIIDLYPATLNDWKEKGWKKKAMWSFADVKSKAFIFSPC
ncbi:hypothetical protein E1B28_008019 [Marasmius oreades]|uniref:Metallo-beta-lactamase domain-containing protein n=1 Tax=Marasmius oreades TaxID=181124 RepID=A0A9P7S2S3_9AGAR|nr:uncharacterized protein E1B28_008019 [Marasmius oreades]KAG7094419.1 hypothetical protein E1B28_008019 [Marasmius oreades]